MRLRRLASVLAVLAAATGCSPDPVPAPDPVTPGPATTALAPPPSTPPSAAPTGSAPTPPVGTRPVVDCLDATYRLVGVTDVDPGAAYASVRGGDVELRFTGEEFPDGNYVGTAYRLVVRDGRALTLTAPDGTRSTLVATVRAVGSYTLESSQATFVRRPGTGSGRLTTGGATTRVDLAAVQRVVAPAGLLTVSCTKTTLWLTGDTVRYELTTA